MVDPAYEKLIDTLDARAWNMAFQIVKCNELVALVSFLFTPEEAAIANAMPNNFATAEEIEANLDKKDLKKLESQLDVMADKGLIRIKKDKGKKIYDLLPFIPGIIDLQFISGIADEWHKQLAVIHKNYKTALENLGTSNVTQEIESTTPVRKIKVDKKIEQLFTIIPYIEMKDLILNSEFVAAATCTCRFQGALLDNPCNKPINNCMIIGESAKSETNRGHAKRLTTEEALKMLDECEEAGLIHSHMSNPRSFPHFICNCCQCHCEFIKGVKRSPAPSYTVNARYLIQINEDTCIGCEACVERCLMESLKMENDKLTRNANRCIGCGICIYVCPTKALKLEHREPGNIATNQAIS